MSLSNRRERRSKINRKKPNAAGPISRAMASFDHLENRVLFSVLPAPTGFAATAPSTNEVDLSWNDSSGETGYIVQAETATTPAPGVWTNVTTVPTDTTSFAVTTIPTTTGSTTTNTPLAAGTSYSFRLIAVDADGNSTPSSTASATTIPAAPVITTSVTSPTAVTVNWTAVPGSTSYILGRSTDLSTWTSIATLTTVAPATTPPLTYSDTGRTANTTYYYRLQAVDASGDSDYSLATSATTQLIAPTGVAASAVSNTQIAISWPSEAGAYGYTLQQQSGTGNTATWANVPGGSSISASTNLFVVGNLTTNTAYTFRLLASNSSGQSAPSTTVSTSTLTAAPVITSVAGSTTTNVISWTAVTGATGYVLQSSPDNSVWTTINTPAAGVLTYTDTALTADTQYFYRLAATNAGGNSAYSPVITQTTNIAANSALTATSASSYAITVGWASQPTASGFKLQVQTGQTWTQVGDIIAAGSTSYTVAALTPNTAYVYRLITENAGGDSAASGTATATTRLARTRVTGSATSDTTVVLNWTNITGNTGYKIEDSADGVTWATVTTTAANATTYTASTVGGSTAFVASTPYWFRVRSTNANGDSSASNVIKRTTLLAAPAGLAATTVSTTAVTLNWTDDTGNAGYVVQKQIHNTWVNIATLATGVDTLAMTNLHAGNTYNFQVLAIDGGGFSAAAAVSGTTLPKSTVVTATGSSTTSILVSWNAIPGVVTYEVDSSPDGGTTWTSVATPAAGTTTYTDTTPASANTPMMYKVRGVNAGGNGAFSPAVATASLLAAPTTFAAASTSDTSISLSWDAEAAATSFRLQKQGTGNTWTQVGALLPAGSTSYIVPNITANTAYTFRLTALNAGGDSLPSATATATTKVPAPVVALGTFTDTTVNLTWPGVANATGYKILRSTSPSTGFAQIGTAAVPSTATAAVTYADTTAAQGTLYYYEVTATNAGGDSLASNIISQTTLMTAPTGLTVVSSEPTSVDLSWTAVAGATGYIVQQQGTTAGTFTQVGSTLGGQVDTTEITGLTTGTSYVFRIIAVDAGGNSVPSATVTTSTILAAPVPAVVAASTTSNTITWPSVTSATGYTVERSLDSGTWTQIATPTAATGTTQTYTDTGLTAGTEYFYRLRSTNAGGNSAYSTVVSTTTLLAAPTGVTATSISASEIDLAWTAQSTATAFIVQQMSGTTSAPVWTQVGDAIAGGSTSAQVTGLATNSAFTFRVIAVNDGGNSVASSSVTATTSTGVTKLKATPLSDTAISLAWTAVTGATGYKIYSSTGGATPLTLLASVGATTTGYTNSGLTANTEYTYYVTVTGAGAESAPSNSVNLSTLLSPPTTFAVGADTANPTTSLDLSWDQSTGNVGYLVQKLVGTVWTSIATTTTGTNSYTATGLIPGATYTFRVCALNVSGTSLPSASASLATT